MIPKDVIKAILLGALVGLSISVLIYLSQIYYITIP
jgi:hypothetical protein